jgi:hypothetical protein
VVDGLEGERHYRGANAFGTLINLYSAEGFLRDALHVAELEQRFGVGEQRLEDLKARLETIRSESVA